MPATELDLRFQQTMTQIAAAKAELFQQARLGHSVERRALIAAGFKQARVARRVAIAKYRELRSQWPED